MQAPKKESEKNKPTAKFKKCFIFIVLSFKLKPKLWTLSLKAKS